MFDSRATATEFLDRPDCDPTLAAASYRFMETVNARFGGIRIVRRFLAAETAGRHARVPLRILDIGSGSCDIPLAVSRWARRHGIPLHFTCLEMADFAIDMARQRLARRATRPCNCCRRTPSLINPPNRMIGPWPPCASIISAMH